MNCEQTQHDRIKNTGLKSVLFFFLNILKFYFFETMATESRKQAGKKKRVQPQAIDVIQQPVPKIGIERLAPEGAPGPGPRGRSSKFPWCPDESHRRCSDPGIRG